MSQPPAEKKMCMDSERKFAHPETTIDVGKKLLCNQEDCDVFFLVGPERVRIGAHTLILKARSSVFEVMFSPRWNEGVTPEGPEIVLKDDEPSTFRSFLQYLYADMFSAHAAQAVKLLHLAQFYDVEPLAKKCRESLATQTLTMDELFQVFMTSKIYKIPYAWNTFFHRIARHFVLLGNSPATLEKFDEETLILFLKRDDLCVEECQLFSILLKWADKQIENSAQDPKPERKDVMKNLVPLVRFPIMTPKEFASVVVPTNVLPEQTVIRLFLYFNSDNQNRFGLGLNLPYAKTRRRGMPIRLDLYRGSVRPGSGVYHNSELKKLPAGARDILTLKLGATDAGRVTERELKTRIVSLMLQGPKCNEAIFRNNLQVGEIFPIKVAISLCMAPSYTNGGHPMFPVNGEVIANVGREEMEVTLDKPWEISSNNLYKITVRFLSEVYTVPKTLDDGSGQGKFFGVENFDFFSSTELQESIYLNTSSGLLEFSKISMSSNAAEQIPGVSSAVAYNLLRVPKALSTGLHLLRALNIQY